MLFSIIIPVYNVERYIARCLESCLRQDLDSGEYEIIVVNDGTPDNSMEIVRAYAQQHSNIVIAEQENMGLSLARNKGLELAKGEYVWFVDSDDRIEDNCLKDITEVMRARELDALQIPVMTSINGTDTLRFGYADAGATVYTGRYLLSQMRYKYPAQFTIYSRRFLCSHGLTFYPKIYHEDFEFSPRAYYHANRVSYYERPVYYYECSNTASIMHTQSTKRAFDMLQIIRLHLNFLQDKPYSDVQASFGTTFGQLINNSLGIITHSGDKTQLSRYLRELQDMPDIYTHMVQSKNKYFKFEAYIFRISPKLLMQFYRIVHLCR